MRLVLWCTLVCGIADLEIEHQKLSQFPSSSDDSQSSASSIAVLSMVSVPRYHQHVSMIVYDEDDDDQ